jgi:hypothetical protein
MRPIGSFNAYTVVVVACSVLAWPIPPISSIVNFPQGIGVGLGHTDVPHGHIYTTILVVTVLCGVNVSPINIIGVPLTRTVALNGFSAVNGISDCGPHQQVLFLILIGLGIGGVEQGCDAWCFANGIAMP